MGTEERAEQPRPVSEQVAVEDRRAPLGPLFAIAAVASVLGIAFGIAIDWFPVQASEQAKDVDTLYDVLIVFSVPMFVLVVSVVLYCAYRFKMRPGEEERDGPPVHGNTRLEVIWTVIPAIMMLGLCTYSYVLLHDAEKAPASSGGQEELKVRVVGEQFTWTFFYPPAEPGGKEIASPQLYLPKDRSILFRVQTKDVLHDFWVPAFRWKIDAVPGITTEYRVKPIRLGAYEIVCAELCGLGHSVMRQTAHVLEPAEFTAWLEKKAGGAAEGGGGDGGGAPDGKQLFASNGCGGCHTLADAGSNSATGPNLDEALAGKDAAFIEESIVEPGAEVAEGFGEGIMPGNYGQTLQPAEIDALVKYLQEATR